MKDLKFTTILSVVLWTCIAFQAEDMTEIIVWTVAIGAYVSAFWHDALDKKGGDEDDSPY